MPRKPVGILAEYVSPCAQTVQARCQTTLAWVTLSLAMFTSRILSLLFLSSILCSCGKEGTVVGPTDPTTQCSGNYNGTWNGNTGGVAVLDSNCTLSISFTGGCTSVGSYQAMLGSFGSTDFTITSLSRTSPCLNVGQHRCSYVFSGSQFSVNCGYGDYVYYR